MLLVASCGGSSPPGHDGGATDATSDAGDVASGLSVGLAGAWSFDTDGADHAGQKLDLDVTGIKLVTGRFGKGLQFTGEGSTIAQRHIDDPSLDVATGDFTVSVWISFAATSTAQFIAIKGYDNGGWFVGWAQTAWAYGFGVPATAMGATFADLDVTPPGGFHHVVLERTGASIEMFVDGQSIGTKAVTDSATPTAAPLQVGGFSPGGVGAGQKVVTGVVDDLAIWHRALTADERAYLGAHAVP
jgi:hypothetical protein